MNRPSLVVALAGILLGPAAAAIANDTSLSDARAAEADVKAGHFTVKAGGRRLRALQRLIETNRLAELDARYVMETDAGDMIYVQNRAVRSGPADQK